jgi:hypothetical protein
MEDRGVAEQSEHMFAQSPDGKRYMSRSARRLWRLPVSGVRAARATTSRVPTITVASVDRVTAV